MSLLPLVFVVVCVVQAIVLLWPANADAHGDHQVRRRYLAILGGGESPIAPKSQRGRQIAAAVWLVVGVAIAIAVAVNAG